jgi:hypothetical protein
MAKLVIRSAGPQMGQEYPLDRPTIRLGRGSGNDVVLQSTQSSRNHAEIVQQGSQFYIRDLGSTNGTFVNEERVTAPRLLQPGDQIRIGDTRLAYEMGPVAAAAFPDTGWEEQLWDEGVAEPAPAEGRPRWLVWALVGVVAVLVVAIGVGAVLMLRGEATPTPAPVVVEPTVPPTQAIVVAPSPTATSEAVAGEPTDSPLVEVPEVEVEPIDTVEVKPVDTVEVKAEVPKESVPALPAAPPVAPGNLEQLPETVTQFLGDVPAEQLPQVISEQMEGLPPEQLQAMIGALFPGVDPSRLPDVVAASFPDLPSSEIEALLGQVFPGQNFQLPEAGPIGGRLAMGIWDPNKGYDLYLVNALGGQRTLLVEMASEPNFSPDGQWLVYYSGDPEHLGLHLVKTNGSEDTRLTSSDQHGYPSFSPDGQRIVFHHYGQDTLYVINRDGSGEQGIAQGQYPAWSPTGDKIVYRGCVGGGKCGLILANANGSNPIQITTHANDAAPRWSPNGGQVAFHSDRDGNWEIYVINVDGSWLRRITLNPTTDVMPVWSPDGLRIAFRSDRGGKGGVWVTSGIGGGATKLIDAPMGPDWAFDQMDWAK